MITDSPVIPDEENIDCPFQTTGHGSLICKCAITDGKDATNEVLEGGCLHCDAGKIYRDVGCDAFTAKVAVYSFMRHNPKIRSILCTKRKRQTNLEYCRTCTLVSAPTTIEIVSGARGLFQSDNFYAAYKHIEDARKGLRDGEYDGSITHSISCLESTIKIILDRLGKPYPADQSLSSLWRAVREALEFDTIGSSETITSLLGTLNGTVSHLGGIRNQMGDAHGSGEEIPEVPYMLAELAVNTASTLSTVLIRRYHERGGQ
jgi:hypothetical protein